MFVTDITTDMNDRSGDWQQGDDNSAKTPTRLFGTWKDATGSGSSITPGADPAQNPNWQLGTGADTPPTGVKTEGYTSEVVWDTSRSASRPATPTGCR